MIEHGSILKIKPSKFIQILGLAVVTRPSTAQMSRGMEAMMTHITTSITMDTTWITAATTMLALHVLLSFVRLWQSQVLHRYQISDVQPSSTIIRCFFGQFFLFSKPLQSAISADIEDYEHGGYDGKQHYVYHHGYDVGRSSHSYHVGAAHVSWLRYLWYFVVWESAGLSKPTGGLNYHLFSDPLLRSLTYNLRFINWTWLISKDADQTKSR